MMTKILLSLLIPLFGFSQGYTSYFTGNTTNIMTTPEFGVCLMGGATEHDNAMRWLLQKANGGDIVVLRSSGSDGYNDYLYSELGETVNSVETLVITSVEGATNPYVLDKVANAELIWFAGGDQWNYVSFFKDNAMEDLLNNHVNAKHAPIGGTSAGMAILGKYYFSAQNGSVTSAEALNNPYNIKMTIGGWNPILPFNDFLDVPFLGNTITDTHYDNPDRKGRHSAFLARIMKDYTPLAYGIACNEYVAICYGADGRAYVYGDYPNYEEYAYFIQPKCNWWDNTPYCQPGQPLSWGSDEQALMVCKVPGTMDGTNYFELSQWGNWTATNSGGSWENWSVNNGILLTVPGSGPNISCLLNVGENEYKKPNVYPNPFTTAIHLENGENTSVEIFDVLGKKVFFEDNFISNTIDTALFSSGLYFVKITDGNKSSTKKILKL